MSVPTDNFAVSEHDSHSDSDWLDIASTDRDSDDNDSICSSREIDHEDPRSRSRQSSLSYGSSRDGDVDAWEGLIEDSADEGMPNDVLAPHLHVVSRSQHPSTFDSNGTQEASPEELRVKEGLDQSMISTLSSSRSSSLHGSTVHNSSRDLRLSFPDPITSSCREPLSTSYEEIQPSSDLPSSSAHSGAPQVEEEVLSASQMLSPKPQATSVSSPYEPELKVFLYGFPTIFKWSIVSRLLQKVACGAGLTINSDLENLQGPVRRLTVSGSFERDRAFPRIITVFDRTLELHDSGNPALVDDPDIRPLAVVFMPCRPLGLPEHVLHLPIVPPSYSSELSDIGKVETDSLRGAQHMLSIPNQRILRISTSDDASMTNNDSIDMIDSAHAYRAFSRLWSGESVPKGILASTHALTLIAIISLILGLVVRATLPVSLHQFTSPTLTTLTPNCTSGSLWQMLRPAPYRERLPPSTTFDNSVVVIPSSFKELSLSVFSAESTSSILSRTNPTSFRRVMAPTLSERTKSSKDLMLQPPSSILPLDNRPKALSVIPGTSPTTSYIPGPDATGHAISSPRHASIPGVVKECASVAFAVMNQDMQDIFDALDALVQAISRQTQMVLMQATTFIEQSAMYLEKSVESFETVKGTLQAHNERARIRAKEIKDKGTKWLYDASEAVSTGARLSKGMAWELAEGFTHRAQRARTKAKEMAAEIQDFLNEHESPEAFGTDPWEVHASHWDEWAKVRRQGSKQCKRKLKSSIFC